MNTTILIEERELEQARTICSSISNADKRNRAVANAIAAQIAARFFDTGLYQIDTKTGLHNVGLVLDDIDISDIYLNGTYVDVRLYFENESICVPVSHFENDLKPALYMFIKINNEISEGVVTGFMLPEDVSSEMSSEGYYIIKEEDLKSFYDIAGHISNTGDSMEPDDADIYDYIDNELTDKNGFYRKLLMSKNGRERLQKIVNAQNIFELVPVEDDVQADNYTGFTSIENSTEEDDFTALLNGEADEMPEAQEESSQEEQSSEGNSEFDISDFMDEEQDEPPLMTLQTHASVTDSEEIETLFENREENSNSEESVEEEPFVDEIENAVTKKKGKSPVVMILLLAVILGAGGYFGYTKYQSAQYKEDNSELQTETASLPSADDAAQTDAMPVETVNPAQNYSKNDEGNAISIDKIEKNLDASILVENLKVNWEVPSGYVSNTSAKRYLVKLGKIIQLNLKTELLLLSKPPITNKIRLELRYDEASKKFVAVGFVVPNGSSGEESVDKVIMNTVNQALNMNINVNTDSFGKLSGNPILVINL